MSFPDGSGRRPPDVTDWTQRIERLRVEGMLYKRAKHIYLSTLPCMLGDSVLSEARSSGGSDRTLTYVGLWSRSTAMRVLGSALHNRYLATTSGVSSVPRETVVLKYGGVACCNRPTWCLADLAGPPSAPPSMTKE